MPEIGTTIVQAALARAGLTSPPETPRELAAFVTNCLSPEVQRRLGDDAATEVEQRITMVIHVLGRASRASIQPLALELDESEFEDERRPASSERSSPFGAIEPGTAERATGLAEFGPEPPSEERLTLPVELDTGGLPRGAAPPTRPPPDADGAVTVSSDAVKNLALGVVSPDSRLASHVREALGDGGQAHPFRTLGELARAAPGTLDVVLVDRRGAGPLATLTLPDTIRGAHVVLWPAKPDAAATLGKSATHVASVTAYGADVAIDDVAVLVRLAAARRAR